MALALDYELDRERLKRRRAIAEAQLQQSMQPLGGTEQISGLAVKRSPFEGIAKVAQAYFSDQQRQAVDTDERKLGEDVRRDTQQALDRYSRATTPRAAVAGALSEDASGNVTQSDAQPAYTPSAEDKRGAAFELMGSAGGDPRDIAKLVVAQAMKPQAEIGKLEPKDYTPASWAQFQATGDTTKLRAADKVEHTPEVVRLIAQRDALPADHPNRKILDDAIKKATTHTPASTVDVKVNTALGTGLAGNVKDIVAATHGAAQGAVGTLDTVNRMRAALKEGNINLGPGATVQQFADQLSQKAGFGGKDTAERLVNTQQVGRGLAQFTLNARKALKGQGAVSDYEGKLLERAESGSLSDFTVPELQAFLAVTDRIARAAHGEHKRMLGVIGSEKDEAIRGLVPYYQVPELPTPGKGLQRNPDGSYTYTPGAG